MEPKRTRTETRLIWITIAGLVAIALYVCGNLIRRAAVPELYDGYRYRNGGPAEWDYPTEAVAAWGGSIAVEALVLCVLVATARRIAGRCFGVAVLTGAACAVLVPMGMHAPITFTSVALWNMFATGWLVMMGLVSAVAMRVVARRDAGP